MQEQPQISTPAFSNQQTLLEEATAIGQVAIYQTKTLGKILTIDQHIILSEGDGFFYHEMMTHPAIFSHQHPTSVAIIGQSYGILDEVLKHPAITAITCVAESNCLDAIVAKHFTLDVTLKNNGRIHYETVKPSLWLKNCAPESFDILILNQPAESSSQENDKEYLRLLRQDGILIMPCLASLLHLEALKSVFAKIAKTGFQGRQTLHFPQPSIPYGWRTVVMATKQEAFFRIREKDVYNRSFATRYYNFDTHKAALVLPEFARLELTQV